MIIGPFWCEQNNCWLQFFRENNRYIAQIAIIDKTNPSITGAWQSSLQAFWSINYLPGEQEPVNHGLSLADGILYYTDFRISSLTKLMRLDQYTLEGELMPVRNSSNSPFLNLSPDQGTPRPFSQLPLTPELKSAQDKSRNESILAGQQAGAEKREADWLKWKGGEVRASINVTSLEGLELFYQQFSVHISSDLWLINPETYSGPGDYLNALDEVISDSDNLIHIQLMAAAARTDFDRVFLAKTTIAYSTGTLYEMKREFIYTFLKAERTLLITTFDLDAKPVHEAPLPIASASNPVSDTNMLIKTAATNAVARYSEWHKGGRSHRGPSGFFSWFRHGATGQTKARIMLDTILDSTNTFESIATINELLVKSNTRYNRHSFASFLLDELKGLANLPWQDVRCISADINLYERQDVIAKIENPSNYSI